MILNRFEKLKSMYLKKKLIKIFQMNNLKNILAKKLNQYYK